MNKISARFDETTNLLLGTLTDVNPVVVGYDRSVAYNGDGVAVVIDDVCLRGRPLCESRKV